MWYLCNILNHFIQSAHSSLLGSAHSSLPLQSPSVKPASPQSSNQTMPHIPQTPPFSSPLADGLSTKLNLSAHSPLATTSVSPAPVTMTTPAHTPIARTSRDQEKTHLTKSSPKSSPSSLLQDSQPKRKQAEAESSEQSLDSLSPGQSPPPRLPQGDTTDSEQSVETPPTSHHTSLSESHTASGDGDDESRDDGSIGELVSTSNQPAESPQPQPSPERSSLSGSTTPDSSALPHEPASDQTTQSRVRTSMSSSSPSHNASRSFQSNTSMMSSSKKVAFSAQRVTSPPGVHNMSIQPGLFSPGSLQHDGRPMFQTPPSSSYQLTSELPPTPFQYANFDLDSSSENEHENDDDRVFSDKSGSSPDFSYGRALQERVSELISQEEIETSNIVRRHDMAVPQPRLVDIDEPLTSKDLPPRHSGLVDSANSLKVDDLLDLSSPSTSQVFRQTPSHTYSSPQVGVLVDIGTPGSGLAARPLLTSTVQGHQASSQDQKRGFVTPVADDQLRQYLPIHSGTQSGALTASSVTSGNTWSPLESKPPY